MIHLKPGVRINILLLFLLATLSCADQPTAKRDLQSTANESIAYDIVDASKWEYLSIVAEGGDRSLLACKNCIIADNWLGPCLIWSPKIQSEVTIKLSECMVIWVPNDDFHIIE